jgi:hypothetical protein
LAERLLATNAIKHFVYPKITAERESVDIQESSRLTMDKMPIKPAETPALDDDAPIFDSGCLALIGKTLFTSVIVGLIAAFKFLGLAFLSIAIIFLPLRLLNVDTGFSLIIAAGVTLLMLKIMGWIRLIKWLLSDPAPEAVPMAIEVCPKCYQSQLSPSIQNCPTCGTRWHN